jgi:hypothetical protein
LLNQILVKVLAQHKGRQYQNKNGQCFHADVQSMVNINTKPTSDAVSKM